MDYREGKLIERLVNALSAALDHYERNVCEHEDTYRGGAIWTICRACGRKWADDEGGFKPFEYPADIEEARNVLRESRSLLAASSRTE